MTSNKFGENIRGYSFNTIVCSEVGFFPQGCQNFILSGLMPIFDMTKHNNPAIPQLLFFMTSGGYNTFFHDLYIKESLNKNSEWYISKHTIYDAIDKNGIRVYSDEKINDMKKFYGSTIFDREFMCEWMKVSDKYDVPLFDMINKILYQNKLCDPSHFLNENINISFDIGKDQFFGTFFAYKNKNVYVLSTLQSKCESISEYIDLVIEHALKHNYRIKESYKFLPFDILHDHVSFYKTNRYKLLKTHANKLKWKNIVVVKKIKNDLAIEIMRQFGSRIYFNEDSCEPLISAMKYWRGPFYKSNSVQNRLYSHAIDSLKYGLIGVSMIKEKVEFKLPKDDMVYNVIPILQKKRAEKKIEDRLKYMKL